MYRLNETHDPARTSWVESANDADCDFSIQNLPLADFRRRGSGEVFRGGVAIGNQVLDLAAVSRAGVFDSAAINFVAPKVRTGGTVLATVGCLAVSAWFFFVVQTGFLENPKISPVVNDPLKSAVMWINAVFCFAAGLFLLRVAIWQSRQDNHLVLVARNTDSKFGGISRYLHWTIAILFLTMLPMGVITAMIPEDVPWRQGYYVVHKTIGFLVLFLVLVRIAWHRISQPPALDGSLKPGERRLAKPAHYLLYFLMVAFPLSGYALSTFGGRHSHFFVWDTPNLWGTNLAAAFPFGLLHKVALPYITYVVIGAHVIGALKHHFIDKHRESIHRMVA